MNSTDFSILFQPVDTITSKKDISMVSGFNSIAQQIEHVLKTNKGELVSNSNLGSNYFTYAFGTDDINGLEYILAGYIEAVIPKLSEVKVRTLFYNDKQYQFQINFSLFDGINVQKNASCFIEVEL